MSLFNQISIMLGLKSDDAPIVENYSLDCIDQIVNLIHPSPGFYIDVGSANARYNSSTYLLYKNGWRGICIDPCQDFNENYKLYRPEDKLLNIAIHHSKKILNYYQYGCSGMNTTSLKRTKDVNILNKNDGEHYSTLIKKSSVKATSLSNILAKSKYKNVPISLLAIDVEGSELEVLKSINLSKNRPLIVVVETLGYSLTDFLNKKKIKPDAVKFLLEKNYIPNIFLRQNIIFIDKFREAEINKFH